MTRAWEFIFGIYVLAVAALLMPVGSLLIILTPGLANRRRLAKYLAKLLLLGAGCHPRIQGLQRLPAGACVVVANHASYLDGVLMKAVLPPRFSFVIKKEARAIPVGGFMLARLGSEFVDRTDGHAGARDAKRIFRAAIDGQALGFFPEGTFVKAPGLRQFRLGAFITACRAGIPVVPVVIRGTRRMLPSGAWLPRPSALSVEVLAAVQPDGADRRSAMNLRDAVRQQLLAELQEPDLGAKTNPR